ncbi:MAG: HDIG domain-containing protein [Candidatus Omnitrophica bacterium]|nr:HDIG domain-containing protein [Candidatus Omnitrophota bacterium]
MKHTFFNNSEIQELLAQILKFAKKHKVKMYLVGGYLRDIILAREKENPDLDFCIKKGAISSGRKLAQRLKCGFVVLDRKHGCARLVKKIRSRIYTLDFTDFRGATLEEDLLRRDFTINTLALELNKAVGGYKIGDSLIDPYGGRKDLAAKTIRVVNPKAFDDDPLRILRAFSLAAVLGFKINKPTLNRAKLKAKYLLGVSFERIRDELFKILHQKDSFTYIAQLDKFKILKLIFPEIESMRGVGQGPYHHLDVWQHTLETIKQLDLALEEVKNNKYLKDYLSENMSYDRKRYALLKLGALLHDIGKPAALRKVEGKLIFHGHERTGMKMSMDIAKRLKLSNDEQGALNKMVLWHLRPGYLADNPEVTARAKFRYFRDAQKESASILLLSLADQRATKGRLTTQQSRIRHEKVVANLLKDYFKKEKEVKPQRLITGDDLIKEFKLKPSVLIGKILGELEELQAIGKIKSKKEALAAAKKIISKEKK